MTSNMQSGPFNFHHNLSNQPQHSGKLLHWTKEDYLKYSIFLAYAKRNNLPEYEEQNLSWGFFRKAAIFLQTKNPNQCRIYHKKMIQSHTSLDGFIQYTEKRIQEFQQKYIHYQSSIQNVMTCINRQRKQAMKQTAKSHLEVKGQQKSEEKVVQKVYRLDFHQNQKEKEEPKPTAVQYPEDNPKIIFSKKQTRLSCGFSLYEEGEESSYNNANYLFKPRNVQRNSFDDKLGFKNQEKGPQPTGFFSFMKLQNLPNGINEL